MSHQPTPHPASPLRLRRRGRWLFAALLLPLLFAGLLLTLMARGTARAQVGSDDLYVAPGGRTSGDCRRTLVGDPNPDPPDESYYSYSTACALPYALAIAPEGSTLRLQEGDYYAAVVITKPLALVGGYRNGFVTGNVLTDPVADPLVYATRLIGPDLEPTVKLSGAATTTEAFSYRLQGLYILHDGAVQGEGISVTAVLSPALSGLTVTLDVVQSWVQTHSTVLSGTSGGGVAVDARIVAHVGLTDTEISGNAARIGAGLFLPAGGTLVARRVAFLDNQADVSGGGIYLDGTAGATLDDATFTGNQATTASGGAIYAADTGLTLGSATGVTLTGNSAGVHGGGLYATAVTLTYSSGVISGNQATGGSGGGLYLGGSAILGAIPLLNNRAVNGGALYCTGGDLTLNGNQVLTNTATTGDGGGIAVVGGATVNLTGLTWYNNQAGARGGAAYLAATDVTVANSPGVYNNQAQSGGGFYVAAENGIATISGNLLLTNTATMGGALFLTGTAGGTLTNNTIEGNVATTYGGGLFLINNQSLTTGDLALRANQAQSGGGLFASNSRLAASGALTLSANLAIGSGTEPCDPGCGGGAYLMSGSALTALSATLVNNLAGENGGALFADSSQFVLTTTTTIYSNTAQTGSGGTLYVQNQSSVALGATTSLSSTAQLNGGVLYAANSTVSAGSLQFERNRAFSNAGGAVYLSNSTLSAGGALTLRYNRAATNGGAVFGSGGSLQASGVSTIVSNTVTGGSGGALYLSAGGALTLTGGLVLQENIAAVNGGAIYAAGSTNSLYLTLTGGSTAQANRALSGSGGAFYLDNVRGLVGALTLRDNLARQHGGGLFANNTAVRHQNTTQVISNSAVTGDGGGLYLSNGISSTFTLLTATSNRAAGSGGAIYATDVDLTFGNNSVLSDNLAQSGRGGGLYSTGGELNFAKVTFERNIARIDGGGLYTAGDLTLANSSRFALNQATTGRGGAIYLGTGGATLTGITVTQNYAQIDGGGLFQAGDSLTVNGGSQITFNTVGSGTGGGLHVAGGTVVVRASRLANNQAQVGGGGLYQTGGSLTVDQAAEIAANTTVTGSGGGLAVISGTVTVDAGVVRENAAYQDGGGLYAPGAQLAVRNGARFTANSISKGRGGAIYVDGTRAVLSGSTLDSNSATAGGGGLYAATLFAGVYTSTVQANNGGRGPGGGLYLHADAAAVDGNTVEQNQTAGDGAGLYLDGILQATVGRNRIARNTVRQDVAEYTVTLTEDVVITKTGQVVARAGDVVTKREVSEGIGAGIFLVDTSAVMTNNIILGNVNAAGEGGGLYVSTSAITMTNNVVARNSIAISDTYGSGLYVISSYARLVHTTIADNRNTSLEENAFGVGLYVTKGATNTSTINLANNIISGHEIGMMLLPGCRASMRSMAWQNALSDWDGPGLYEPVEGMVRGDPAYVNPDGGDYHIQRRSAAFDVGIDAGVAVDLDGVPRPRAFGIDAGAYEQRYVQGVHMKVTATPRFVGNDETIQYTAQIVNHSLVPLSNVRLNFALPPEQSVTSIGGGPCSGTGCTFASLGVNQGATVTLRAVASGDPPPEGFIEMVTTISVSSPSFSGGSDTQEVVTTRLQECRINYAGRDYPDFAAAIAAVDDFDDVPDIIRVAGTCGGPVEIKKKLTLQGGWNFSMTTRDPAKYKSIIDSAGTGRVMKITGDIAPTIEYLTLRNGSASGTSDGPSGKSAGAVLYIKDAKALVRNVTIAGGKNADHGGGIYVAKLTAPTIRDSIVEGNDAWAGGGLYAFESSPELINVTFRRNTAVAGGGLYFRRGQAKVIGCTIRDNNANGIAFYLEVAGFNVRFTVGGGGGVNLDESKASITGSTIVSNTATAGGGVFADNSPGAITTSSLSYNKATTAPVIVPILVLANKAGGGGAIYAQRADLVLEYNRFEHNTATTGGAVMIFNGTADGRINGNYFGFNQGAGSAIFVWMKPTVVQIFLFPFTIPDMLLALLLGLPDPDPPKLVIYNNTFAHNLGTVIRFFGNSHGELVGNIFADNSGTAVSAMGMITPYIMLIPVPIIMFIPLPLPVFDIPTVSANYTLWYDNGTNTSTALLGRVNTENDVTGPDGETDPAFKNDGYHIKRISAAYNTGKNTGIPVDLDGQTRPQGDRTDVGADEYPLIGVRYVSPTGGDDGSNYCRNYRNPCGSLQTAIDAAREGDLIKMAGGTYTGVETRMGQVQMGFITKTLTIQGGYFPRSDDNDYTDNYYTDWDWEDPHPNVNPTILDAGSQGRIFYILDEKKVDEEGNPIEVKPILSGLQLKNGNATGLRGPEANLYDAGGAIYVDHATATIRNVRVADSVADFGAGVYMISSALTLQDVTVTGNRANERGGGFYLDDSPDVTLANIVIENNKAPRGGGLYLYRSPAILRLNRISANGDSSGTVAGGGLFLDASDAQVISNTITANNAINGGGLYLSGSKAQVAGNEITNNKALNAAAGRGGGVFLASGAATLRLNLVQGNQAIAGGGYYLEESEAQVQNDQVTENVAHASGGGFYLHNSSAANILSNTITNNRAAGTGENDGGGGLYLDSSNSNVQENTITGNTGNAGGGVYLFSFSNASLLKNTIRRNSATNDGGGVYLKLSNASLEQNIITENRTVKGSGGGVYAKLSGATFRQNTVDNNQATLSGGGFYLDESGARLQQDTARTNQARDGGGIYIFRSNTASFDGVAIQANEASRYGGGLYIRLSDIPLADHQILTNTAGSSGGGIYLDESSAALSRMLLRANQAGQRGGGMTIARRSAARLGSNAIVDNSAGSTGSGIYIAGSNPSLIHTTIARNGGGDGSGIAAEALDSTPSVVGLVNTILAGQTLAVRATQGSTITLEATLWDGNSKNWVLGAGAIVTGTANLNFFGQARFQADGIHLQKNSKAIGVGVTTDVSRDIDGDGRPQGNGPELGADEMVADCAAVASSNLQVVYSSVQAALDAAQPGDEVRISGTCVGVTGHGGLSQLAYVEKNITVRGGYTPTNWLVSYPITQPTFLDAMGDGRVIFVAPGISPLIEHLNLANGEARGLGGGPGGLDAGGILYVRNATPTLRNLTLTGGNAYYGGGAYLQATASPLADSTFESNQATKGGAIFLRNSTARLAGNTIRNNLADDGGGIFLSFSQPVIVQNRVSQNSATAAGGGIFLESSPAVLRSNSVTTNTAQAAGGIYVDGASPQVIRNTIADNTGQNAGGLYLSQSNALVDGNLLLRNSAGIGGGLYMQGGAPDLVNNVIAKNSGEVQAAAIYVLSASPQLRHNTIAANSGGDGSGLFVTDLGVDPSNLALVNNILVAHTTAITVTPGNKVTLRATLWNNNQSDWGGEGIVQDNGGSLHAAPSFVSLEGDDFHLQNNSPARDQGVNAGVDVDFDNQARPADNGYDIGADEFVFIGMLITMQTVPDPVVAGAPFDFIVRVINQGNIDLDATITAKLPPELTPSGTITWTATIPRGEDFIQTLRATVKPGFAGTLKPVVTVATAQGLTQEKQVTITVERPDYALQIEAEASPIPAPPGGNLDYQIRVTNVGNRPLQPTVQAILPEPVSVASTLTFNPNVLGPGGVWSKSVQTRVDPAAKGRLTAVFRATSSDLAVPAVYTLTVPVAAPRLEVNKFAIPTPALAGRVLTYTLLVTNTGNVDFVATMTDSVPLGDNGRPLIAPGANTVYSGVALPKGGVWRQTVVAVVEPGYTGPLNSRLEVATTTGLSAAATDTRQVELPAKGVTIRAIRSGDWNDPNNWDLGRVPNAHDVALVPEGITLDANDDTANPITLTGLVNRGTILLHCREGVAMRLEISGLLENSGLIVGDDADELGESGCSVEVQVNTLLNNGTIRSGNGADGGNGLDAGDGGAMRVFGQSIVNNHQILAGNGGNVPPPNTEGRGGAGGDALVIAGPPSPALLLNRGLIAAGNGGTGPTGGDGGDMALLSMSLFSNDGGRARAGKGGEGRPANGADGAVAQGASATWDNGVMRRNRDDYAFSALAPARVRGPAGGVALAPVFLLNLGLRADGYQLIWYNAAGWPVESLPTSLKVSQLQAGLLLVSVPIPSSAATGDTAQLRLTIRSQGKPELFIERTIQIVVGEGGLLYLPSVPRSAAVPTGESGDPASLRLYLPRATR